MAGIQTYERTDIQTSDPRAVVVLLYEGAIKFLGQALDALEQDDRNGMSTFLNKTQKIIQFLITSLDFDNGEEIADNLNRLYCYMRDRLNEANLRCDKEIIEEVIELFKPLLEAWREIAKDPEAAKALENRANDLPPLAQAPGPAKAPETEGPAPRAGKLAAGRAAYGIKNS